MITLGFRAKNNKSFIITIESKVVKFWEAKSGEWQILPKDLASAQKKILMSRNSVPPYLVAFLNIPSDEYQEYLEAHDETALKEIIIRDCNRNGCDLIEGAK